MKKYKDLCDYDFSDYAEEITGNALFKINGGAEVENSHEGVANAQVGDTITRNSGEVVVLKQADIDYAQQQLGTYGNQETNNTSTGTQNYSGGSNQTTSEPKEPVIQKKNDWIFNPNEPDSDKRYNAKDIGGLHVMTISCEDMNNIGDFANYYIMIGQYGTAGNTKYHGIALTDKNGDIIHILKDEGAIKRYTDYLASSTDKNINVMDVVGGVSTATGISSDILNYIDTGAKASNGLGKISTAAGYVSIASDIVGFTKKPSFSKACDIAIDGIGFIPDGGALLSLGLSVGKEKLEEETSAALALYKNYKIKDTLYKFVPSQNNDIFFDQDYFFMKGVSNQIKEIFRGN